MRASSKLMVTALAFCIAGCGGGGGGSSASVASSPPPPTETPPPPGPSPSSAVDIFPSPATQEFATIGTGDDLRIRYDAASNKYEVMAEGQGWVGLLDDPHSSPQAGSPNTSFVFAGSPVNHSHFLIRAHHSYSDPDVRYLYSNLAAWGVEDLGGFVAFGIATPSGGMPTAGSASYKGMIEGRATDTSFDYLAGALMPGAMIGNISLVFDFGGGSLSGSLSPILYLDKQYPLGTFSFENTIYSTGSTSFSGQFDTNVAGSNSFSGQFTGPAAQELIGKFAFPYMSPVSGTPQQSQGAFIAKR